MPSGRLRPYLDGPEETRQDFTANDFRITRALESLLISAKSIKHDDVACCRHCRRLQNPAAFVEAGRP